jgi:hypothetical protein
VHFKEQPGGGIWISSSMVLKRIRAVRGIHTLAAMGGHVEVLKYAHQNGWAKETCSLSAGMGHADCLQYARENGCPRDRWTCKRATLKGHLDVLIYAHEDGCPWDEF